jgi:hypothetical protein
MSLAIEHQKDELTCDACGRYFRYRLVHAGFSNTAYAYCDECGMASLLSAYGPVPDSVQVPWHEAISTEVESHLRPCPCGGHFVRGSAPRCPTCKAALSADAVAAPIEAGALGTAKGWRWQRSWTGLYCVIVKDRVVNDNWLV